MSPAADETSNADAAGIQDAAVREKLALPPGPYVARADRVFRIKRYIVVLLMVGFGLLSAYHGFVSWPRETAQYERIEAAKLLAPQGGDEYVRLVEEQKQYTHHSGTDILFNRVMAVLLPPLAVVLLARWLYISRGEVRLDVSDTLFAPGHPPIPIAAVTRLDDDRWERKGIALVEYTLPDGSCGLVRLDHDWYEPKAIHAIHGRLAHLVAMRSAPAPD
jgi:hypothetical protein